MTHEELIMLLSAAVDSESMDIETIEQGHFAHEADAYASGVGDAWDAVRDAINNLPSGTAVA